MALRQAGIEVDQWSSILLRKLAIDSPVARVDLLILTVAELGLGPRTHYGDICRKAQQLGLELCPAEVGPALLLSYHDQPAAERLHVAMAAIVDADGDPCIFTVASGDRPRLDCSLAHADSLWLSDSRFLFVRPRAVSLYDKAVRLRDGHNLEEAHSFFERARTLYHFDGDPEGELNCLMALITYHQGMTEDEQALPLCERALELLQMAPTPRTQGMVLLMRHWCAPEGESNARRIQRLVQALSLLEHHEEPHWAAMAHRAIAGLLARNGRLGEARASLLQAIPLHEVAGSRLGAAAALRELARLELKAQHARLACAYLELALERLRGVPLIGARLGESQCYEGMGDAWMAHSDPEQARTWYEKALALCRKFEFSTRAITRKLAQ